MDTVSVPLSIPETKGLKVQGYTIEIRSELDAVVYSLSKREEPRGFFKGKTPMVVPGDIVWDGKTQSGEWAPDGLYLLNVQVYDYKGNTGAFGPVRITVDNTAPAAELFIPYTIFSPNGDGSQDSLDVYQRNVSSETLWVGTFLDASKNAVKTYKWKGQTVNFPWDGKDDSGQLSPDGLYQYLLKSTDNAGNSATYVSSIFSLDTQPTPVQLTQSVNVISPNNDGDSDVVQFYPKPLVKDGIESWSFSVLNEKDIKVFSVAGEGAQIPSAISWDGHTAEGAVVEGFYRGVVDVEYQKGNSEQIASVPNVAIDLTEPVITVSTSGLPFSPDGDGENDVLNLTVVPKDPSGIKSWTGRILDPTGELFFTLSPGSLTNGTFSWNGKDKKGELVQSASDYTLEVKAEDMVGNKSSVKKTIPIDILVIKDGDRLRISISSIYFKPFTADYLSVEPAQKASNLKTLDRLAEILKKYSQYNIQLEGHAVRLLWSDPLKWKTEEDDVLMPLSQSRADTIKSALVQRGIKMERMTTKGLGGYKPVVPHSDEQNRWKNRRVEFILIK